MDKESLEVGQGAVGARLLGRAERRDQQEVHGNALETVNQLLFGWLTAVVIKFVTRTCCRKFQKRGDKKLRPQSPVYCTVPYTVQWKGSGC